MLKLETLGLKEAERFMKKAPGNVRKAMPAASKAVGFKYSRILKREMAKGAPGGRKWEPLTTTMKRYRRAKSLRGRTPYKQMSGAIRYYVDPRGVLSIGLLDTGPQQASRSWLAKARAMTKAKPILVTDVKRGFFGKYGTLPSGRGQSYGLKRETRFLKPPERPIIGPYARAHKQSMFRDYEHVYFQKLAGRFAKI